MRDIVTRQCPQTTTFEEKGEPKLAVLQWLTVRTNRLIIVTVDDDDEVMLNVLRCQLTY